MKILLTKFLLKIKITLIMNDFPIPLIMKVLLICNEGFTENEVFFVDEFVERQGIADTYYEI